MQSLLAWIGRPDLETVAVGDSETDLEMFRIANRSYAPAQMQSQELAQLLRCRIADRPHQAGLLSIVRSLVHPHGGRCERCQSVERLWPRGKEFFLDLLELADNRGRANLLGALLHPSYLRALER